MVIVLFDDYPQSHQQIFGQSYGAAQLFLHTCIKIGKTFEKYNQNDYLCSAFVTIIHHEVRRVYRQQNFSGSWVTSLSAHLGNDAQTAFGDECGFVPHGL